MLNNAHGSIQYANVTAAGSGYFYNDRVTIDVSGLRATDGDEAAFEVTLTPPDDYQVITYAKTTDHHYEKLVTKADSRSTDRIDQDRYIINKDQLSNGVIYLTGVTGSYSLGELAFVKANTDPLGDSIPPVRLRRSTVRHLLALRSQKTPET